MSEGDNKHDITTDTHTVSRQHIVSRGTSIPGESLGQSLTIF